MKVWSARSSFDRFAWKWMGSSGLDWVKPFARVAALMSGQANHGCVFL